jgi:hypothetical protein
VTGEGEEEAEDAESFLTNTESRSVGRYNTLHPKELLFLKFCRHLKEL